MDDIKRRMLRQAALATLVKQAKKKQEQTSSSRSLIPSVGAGLAGTGGAATGLLYGPRMTQWLANQYDDVVGTLYTRHLINKVMKNVDPPKKYLHLVDNTPRGFRIRPGVTMG